MLNTRRRLLDMWARPYAQSFWLGIWPTLPRGGIVANGKHIQERHAPILSTLQSCPEGGDANPVLLCGVESRVHLQLGLYFVYAAAGPSKLRMLCHLTHGICCSAAGPSKWPQLYRLAHAALLEHRHKHRAISTTLRALTRNAPVRFHDAMYTRARLHSHHLVGTNPHVNW